MISPRFSLEETCTRHGTAIAFTDGHREVSYAELASAVEAQANAFLQNGIGKGDRVWWCPGNDFQTLVTFWSLFSIGAVACPINPRFPANERVAIAQRLGAHWDAEPKAKGVLRSRGEYDRHAAATIILSSGSSGDPKAIVHSLHAHVVNAIGASSNMPLGEGDRWIWSLPSYHVSGLAILIRCAVAGATIHGLSESEQLSAEILAAGRITHVSVVATQLKRLLREDAFPSHSCKAVLLGGSAVAPSLVRTAVERGVPIHSTYGLTEMASQVTTSRVKSKAITSGHVLPHRELRIDDSGEILVRGETLCMGYQVGGQVVSVADEDGWFHTGDLGELNEHGELFVLGRKDNMFISGGENIYPEAIERAMLDLSGVEEAIVVATADAEFGFRPTAFVSAEVWRESVWTEALRLKLRSFEIPVGYLPFPEESQAGLKPSRAKLSELANGRTGGATFRNNSSRC